ncbi:MAG: aspartate aminotransferase family protein [Oscillospiraceae bacterium]|nr:aspartate aminotransferase family protein [Oscillospiraceae bacterium]
MDFLTAKETEQQYLMQTYGRFQTLLTEGKGAKAVDCDGKEYIDFTSGIGVNALGYCNDHWLDAVTAQAGKLQHTSNLYYSEPMIRLAEKLCTLTGMDKVFFGNSGAEANECAIKLARKYGSDTYGEKHTEIVTLKNSFHGRTITTLSATGQAVFHQHFQPFTEGFAYGEANDLDSVVSAVTDNTCAVMVEFVQGEGGVCPLEKAFVKKLYDFCKDRDILLIADEIQTGIGRTGTLFAYEQFGVQPDIVTSAKGLGGGLPIGACLCVEKLGKVLGPGLHGTTFGGNPVVCAGALAVLEQVAEPSFLQAVAEKGAYLREKLQKMDGVESVRGLGMMIGVVLKDKQAGAVASACVEKGLLVLTAKTLIRFLPPLTISYEEIDCGLERFAAVLQAE